MMADDPDFDAAGHWREPVHGVGGSQPAPQDEEIRRALEAGLAALPPEESRAFRLREVAGRSIEAICEEMQLMPAQVLALLHAARLRLHRTLERALFQDEQAAR